MTSYENYYLLRFCCFNTSSLQALKCELLKDSNQSHEKKVDQPSGRTLLLALLGKVSKNCHMQNLAIKRKAFHNFMIIIFLFFDDLFVYSFLNGSYSVNI